MPDPRTLAAAAGLTVEFGDLGPWPASRLVAEYDGPARTIRVNERALEAYRTACGGLDSCRVRAFIDLAVAHELYHHREASGEVARLATRAAREAEADAYARSLVAVDPPLDAFLRGASAADPREESPARARR